MKPRPTDEEFAELARQRDEALEAVVQATCDKMGWPREKTTFHVSGLGKCYCACPDGPCQHIWDGPTVEDDNCVSVTCSRCGANSFSHDLRFAE